MKRFLIAVLAAIMMLSMSVSAFAGDGDGSGGGKDKPLELAECSMANGSTNVPTDVNIHLVFTKNVVNFTVKDNNMGCFYMVDDEGNNVPISVLMGDDQIDESVKRIIDVQATGLTPGTTYTLVIGSGITSKSGVSLGYDIPVTFTTEGTKPTPTVEPEPTEDPKPTKKPKPTKTPKEDPEETPTIEPTIEPTQDPEQTEEAKKETKKKTAVKKTAKEILADKDTDTKAEKKTTVQESGTTKAKSEPELIAANSADTTQTEAIAAEDEVLSDGAEQVAESENGNYVVVIVIVAAAAAAALILIIYFIRKKNK